MVNNPAMQMQIKIFDLSSYITLQNLGKFSAVIQDIINISHTLCYLITCYTLNISKTFNNNSFYYRYNLYIHIFYACY